MSFELVSDNQLVEEVKSIPDKMAFKIGDVAKFAGIKQHVLRYWESEFDALNPQKSNHNQRMYSKKDVELVLVIKKLLYRDRYSIEGAREALRRLKAEFRNDKGMREIVKSHAKVKSKAQALLEDLKRLKTKLEL